MEIWKKNIKHEGYEFSSDGRIRSYFEHNGFNYNRTPKILKPGIGRSGYKIITLVGKKSYILHRLIADTFIPNPNNYPTVDHKDRNRTNNRISNLRWATIKMQRENANYKGSANSNSKLTEKDIPLIFKLRSEGKTQQQIADVVGIGRPTISKILLGKNWKIKN